MKTKEQLDEAKDLIKGLQDYIELSVIEKKLKLDATKKNTSDLIDNIVDIMKIKVNEL